MDPEAALCWAMDYLKDGDVEEAEECLASYRGWRAGGGFEPPNGDVRAAHMEGVIKRAEKIVGMVRGTMGLESLSLDVVTIADMIGQTAQELLKGGETP